MKSKNTGLFHFRRYKKEEGKSKKRHPKLIVDEKVSSYGYMGLTENSKKGKHHRNIPLLKNPKKMIKDRHICAERLIMT